MIIYSRTEVRVWWVNVHILQLLQILLAFILGADPKARGVWGTIVACHHQRAGSIFMVNPFLHMPMFHVSPAQQLPLLLVHPRNDSFHRYHMPYKKLLKNVLLRYFSFYSFLPFGTEYSIVFSKVHSSFNTEPYILNTLPVMMKTNGSWLLKSRKVAEWCTSQFTSQQPSESFNIIFSWFSRWSVLRESYPSKMFCLFFVFPHTLMFVTIKFPWFI